MCENLSASEHHGEKGQGTAAHNHSQLDPQWGREGHQQVSANGMTDRQRDSGALSHNVSSEESPDRQTDMKAQPGSHS